VKHIWLYTNLKLDGKDEITLIKNQELIRRKYSSTFFRDPPHHPHNHRIKFTDIQGEIINTTENPVPY